MCNCVGCVTCFIEPTGELPVDNAQTDSTAAAAGTDAVEKSLSPTQPYVSYDERPLPATRRFLLAESLLRSTHTNSFTAILSIFTCCLVLCLADFCC